METKLQELKNRLHAVDDLHMANAVLGWDQTTYMPAGGARARLGNGHPGAPRPREVHRPAVGSLLDDLRPYEEGLPYDSDDAALIRVHAASTSVVRVPSAFVAEIPATPPRATRPGRRRGRRTTSPVEPYSRRRSTSAANYADYFPATSTSPTR